MNFFSAAAWKLGHCMSEIFPSSEMVGKRLDKKVDELGCGKQRVALSTCFPSSAILNTTKHLIFKLVVVQSDAERRFDFAR